MATLSDTTVRPPVEAACFAFPAVAAGLILLYVSEKYTAVRVLEAVVAIASTLGARRCSVHWRVRSCFWISDRLDLVEGYFELSSGRKPLLT